MPIQPYEIEDDYIPGEDPPHENLHLIPLNDIFEHDPNNHCWCKPVYDEELCGYIHNAYDGRLDYEDGLRKPH